MVVRNIGRIVELLKTELHTNSSSPLIAVATMIPNARSYQAPYVNEINLLLLRYRSAQLPVYIRFDRNMSTSLLSHDGLHPNSQGYDHMADVAAKFMTTEAQTLSRRRRPDSDGDGVYDLFERTKYHTKRHDPDTDHDSYSDGEEIFVLHTNPLDPLDPPPTPTPTASPTPEETPAPTATPTPLSPG